MQVSLRSSLKRSSATSVTFLLVHCASETIFLLVPVDCLSAPPAVTQRMNRCHTPQNGVIACHSPSRQFILLDVALAPRYLYLFTAVQRLASPKEEGEGKR